MQIIQKDMIKYKDVEHKAYDYNRTLNDKNINEYVGKCRSKNVAFNQIEQYKIGHD